MKILTAVVGAGTFANPYRSELADTLQVPTAWYIDHIKGICIAFVPDGTVIDDTKPTVIKGEKKPASAKLNNLLAGKFPVTPGDDIETVLNKVAETIEPALKEKSK